MLSIKSIAGFLKKVSSSGRDDAGKDARKRGGAESGTGAGSGSVGGGNSAMDNVSSNVRGNPSSRAAAAGSTGLHGSRKNDDTNFAESPLFGMPSAFGDNTMFAASHVLKGLPPNTSTQDVLRHIQRVVQERSEELQKQQDEQAADAEASECGEAEPPSNTKVRDISPAVASKNVEGVSPRPIHSHFSTAVPSPMDLIAINNGLRAASVNCTSEVLSNIPFAASTTTAGVSQANLQILQKIRGEMIDALDVCLQEVPEENAKADEEKARQEKLTAAAAAAASGGNTDSRNLQEFMPRSSSALLPSFFNLGPSGSLDGVGAGAGGAADALTTNWEDNNNTNNALLDGTRTETGTVTPRNPSAVMTPVEAAELSMLAVPSPDSSSSPAPAPVPAPTVFTHYEWRCLLLQIVEVIVRIDRAVMADIRHRAMGKFASGVALPFSTNPVSSSTEFRWRRLSQAFPPPSNEWTGRTAFTAGENRAVPNSLSPTRLSRPGDTATAAVTATTLPNSPQLQMGRSEALLHSPEDAEALTLPIPTTVLSMASGQATPKELPVPTNAPMSMTANTTANNILSPIGKSKRTLEENGILSPDNRVDCFISKDDKKILEELLTVACLLATWAIIKAILRHHLQVLNNSRQRSKRRTNAAAGDCGSAVAGGVPLPPGTNVPPGWMERTALDLSLSNTEADLAATGNSAISWSVRPSLTPLPPPVPLIATNKTTEKHNTDEVGGLSLRMKTSNDVDPSDDVPYIDWEAVVQELDEWMGNSPGHIVAECTLCASFLRDDGREMVMCMLQKPKPRHLLSSIHRHAEKLRHTDPSALVTTTAAPAPVPTAAPMLSPRVQTSGPSTPAATPSTAPSSMTNTAPNATAASLAGTAAASSGPVAANPNPTATATAAPTTTTTTTGAVPPSPTIPKMTPSSPSSMQTMLDDPTLVMDDLVAQLELVYRRAVGDTWSSYLEKAIEAEMISYVNPATTEAAMTDKTEVNEKASSAVPQGANNIVAEESSLRQPSSVNAQLTSSDPESLLMKECITDTKTLCRLAAAYFFGSDAWSERKRERRFTLLSRSMRSRMEHYSESAATRRNIRRATSSAASPTPTNVSTAVASPVEANAFSEPPTSSQQQQKPSDPSAMAAGPVCVVPPVTSTRTSLSPISMSPPNAALITPAVVLTPRKFSVEDASFRATTAATGVAAAAVSTFHIGSTASAISLSLPPAFGNSTDPLPRQGLPSSQPVGHQPLSSNASNAAGSNYSTPLGGSLHVSRDGGGSDGEATSSTPHVVHAHSNNNGVADPSALPTAEQSASWIPVGLLVTPSGNMTPPPESDQILGPQRNTKQKQQAPHSDGPTPPRSDGDDTTPRFAAGGSAALPTPQQQPSLPTYHVGHPLSTIVLERIVNMSWSAALHKRGEQCLSIKPPRLEEAEQNAQEERLVAGAFGEFRARQRSLVSLINARLASGKSVEALGNAQKHFRFEKKDWTSHSQTIFSALRYLQSMVLLVRAQAACRVYGAVIETAQFVLPQARLCEQLLQVLAPRPRRDCIIRFADCRSKLLRSYVYLLKECWLAHAAFNDHAKAAKYFSQCAQVLQMLRRHSRESELFAAYLERGSQLMKMKDYKKSVELFKLAVNIAKKSLQDADAAAAGTANNNASGTATSTGPSLGTAGSNLANAVSAAASGLGAKSGATTTSAVSSQHFHRNLHFRSAGSGQLYTAEEHIVGTSAAAADYLEFTWRVAESERMLALSYVTQAEHEVNVRERREELSNAVSNAYSSQRTLQRWQTKGGTPKRLLTAVPCSLIVICKGLLLLNQARKAALLLEPLIENKPTSASVRPPMWREILDPTEDPYTAEDVVLRTYVCSVKIAVYMLYARCLAEFDGERALRAVTQVDQLLQESDAWIYAIRKELRHAMEEMRNQDKNNNNATVPLSPLAARSFELPSVTAPLVAAKTADAAAAVTAVDENEDAMSTAKQGGDGADTAALAKTTDVPPLSNYNATSTTGDSVPVRMSSSSASHHSHECNSPDDAPPRQRRLNVMGSGGGVDPSSSAAPSRDDLLHDEDEHSRQSIIMQNSAGSVNADIWNDGYASGSGGFPVPPSSVTSTNIQNASAGPTQALTNTPTLSVHMESASECMTALFALREGKSHIRKALRDIFIVSGDAHSLIKNWEEALKSYSHALVISMSEVEAANAAAKSRRRVGQYPATARGAGPSPHTSNMGGNHDGTNSLAASPAQASANGAVGSKQQATAGGAGASTRGVGGGVSIVNNAASTIDARGNSAAGIAAAGRNDNSSSKQGWGQVVPLDEEFFLWDEEDGLIADNLVNRDLTASTAAKDLRAVVADEERMNSRACESLVLSKLANVYRALDKPTTAIHYHNLVLDYANECGDKLLAYNSMLSLARLYTAAAQLDEARDMWAKVSDLAKEYEDKEVSRETKRNIVAGQESAAMYHDVVKTAEELEKLATGEEGEDAAADRRFALEALANANLQLGQYDACIAALDSREKVQEKSAEWNGRLLSMRAKARMGLNKPSDAIKVMQSWANKARNLGNWIELGRANSALSAAYASENQNVQARHYHEATLNAFALAETLNEDCQHIALDSARWLVHYAYLDDSTVQIDPSLTYTGGCLTSDSEASGGDFRYADSGLCNSSGDLGKMLAKEEEMRRSSSSLIANTLRARDGNAKEDEEDFFGSGGGNGGNLANHSLFGMRYPNLTGAETPKADNGEEDEYKAGEKQKQAPASNNAVEGGDKGSEAFPAAADKVEKSKKTLQRILSSSFPSKDPGYATQPPSLASSINHSEHEFAPQQNTLESNLSGSSAGQMEVDDSDALVAENEDEARRRREVDEALRTMDDEVEAGEPQQHSASEVATAVAAAAQNGFFFNMDEDDDMLGTEDLKSTAETTASEKGTAKSTSSSINAVLPTPNITTAAVKTSGNTTTAGGTKSASSSYVPPPTALANVSICSRPAAAAAGTDVLELPVDTGRSASEPASSVGSSGRGSPLVSSGARGSGGFGFGDGRDSACAEAVAVTRQDGEDNHHERKPSAVRTTYYRGAIEMMETTAQLLLVPRNVSRLVIPYSPAEAVDFALLAHPHSLFVFYFAEYTTEYGAQCDVVVRPPGTAGYVKLRTQVSLKEYHSKDVMATLLKTLSAETAVVSTSSASNSNTNNTDSAAHPFGGAMGKTAAAAAGGGGGNGSAGASLSLSHVHPDALRAALDDETRSCLRNLHAEAWQPILDRLQREQIYYQDAEKVIIMPDIALLNLPFAGLLPPSHYNGDEAPLGEQFTLIVTPSLTHFVYHGMSEQHAQQYRCGALDPYANRYIFIPYEATNTGGTTTAAAAGGKSSTGAASAGSPSAPSSPRPRQQPLHPTKVSATSQLMMNPSSSVEVVGKTTNSSSSAALPSSRPPLSPAHSTGDSTVTAQAFTFAATGIAINANGTVLHESTFRDDGGADALLDGVATPAGDGTFDGLLKTWRVHRGCTRKELIHAFTDCQTRALMFLGPIDLGGVRVADGVVKMQDIMQSLQQARSQQAAQNNNNSSGNGTVNSAISSSSNNNNNQSTSAVAPTHAAAASFTPSVPPPPLCTYMDLLILTADRGFYPSVTNAGMTVNLCMSLGVPRVLRLNIIHGLDPNDEHREFIARFFVNLRKVLQCKLSDPYAVALRTTIAEARAKGMASSTWGAFTLVGSA